MKNISFLAFLTIFAFLGVLTLGAQDQSGSVAIAGHIRPKEEVTISSFTKCVLDLKGSGTKDRDAIGACTKMAEVESKTSRRIANEAADATKASRPMMVLGGYGYGYGSGYYGGYRNSYPYWRNMPPPSRRLPPRQPPPPSPSH